MIRIFMPLAPKDNVLDTELKYYDAPLTDMARYEHTLNSTHKLQLDWYSEFKSTIYAQSYCDYRGFRFYTTDDYHPIHEDGVYHYQLTLLDTLYSLEAPVFDRRFEVEEEIEKSLQSGDGSEIIIKRHVISETEFTVNANLGTAANLIVDALHRIRQYENVTLAECKDTPTRPLTFSGVSILDAIKYIGNEFGVDFWIDNGGRYDAKSIRLADEEPLLTTENAPVLLADSMTKVLHFEECRFRSTDLGDDATALDLTSDGEYPDLISVEPENDSTIPAYIAVYGSERNILPKSTSMGGMNVQYGTRLRLPDDVDVTQQYINNSPLAQYATAEEGSRLHFPAVKGLRSEVMKFDEIYPSYSGTVTAVRSAEKTIDGEKRTIYYITDKNIPFEIKLNDGVAGGDTVRLVFSSGLLNGMDFAVGAKKLTDGSDGFVGYEFEIVADTEYGVIPNETLKPDVGDTYTPYNFAVPEELTELAQVRLINTAILAIAERIEQIPSALCRSVSEAFARRGIDYLPVGTPVKITSLNLSPFNAQITRVQSVSFCPTTPYDVEFRTSDISESGRLEELRQQTKKAEEDARKRLQDQIKKDNANKQFSAEILQSLSNSIIKTEDRLTSIDKDMSMLSTKIDDNTSGLIAEVNGKNTTHISKPTKYLKGDLWILESDTVHTAGKKGDMLTARMSSKEYNAAHWQKDVRYTDDTEADKANVILGNPESLRDRLLDKLGKDGFVDWFNRTGNLNASGKPIMRVPLLNDTGDDYADKDIKEKLTGDVLMPAIDDTTGKISWTRRPSSGIVPPAPTKIKPIKGVDYFDGKDGTNGKDGAKGDKGDQGDRGIQGERGLRGLAVKPVWNGTSLSFEAVDELGTLPTAVNLKGERGLQGVKGDTGAKGDKGDQGDRGIQGERGLRGLAVKPVWNGTSLSFEAVDELGTLPTAVNLKGERGLQGVKGDTGAKGDKGDTGAPGINGKSAYQAAKEAGYKLTEPEFNRDMSSAYSTAINAKQTADGIQVGGRNLIGKYKAYNINGAYSIYTKLSETYFGQDIQRIEMKSDNSQGFSNTINVSLKANEPIVISFYVRTVKYIESDQVARFYLLFEDNTSFVYVIPNLKPSDTFQQVSYVYTPEKDETIQKLYIYGSSKTGGISDLTCPKIEHGNRATTWTPAPEDTDADIEYTRRNAFDEWFTVDNANYSKYIFEGRISLEKIGMKRVKIATSTAYSVLADFECTIFAKNSISVYHGMYGSSATTPQSIEALREYRIDLYTPPVSNNQCPLKYWRVNSTQTLHNSCEI